MRFRFVLVTFLFASSAFAARFDELTPRERAVLLQVVEGRLNKQIAGELGITETTVKVHRSNMMRKIRVASLAELCRLVDRLNLSPEQRHGNIRSDL